MEFKTILKYDFSIIIWYEVAAQTNKNKKNNTQKSRNVVITVYRTSS